MRYLWVEKNKRRDKDNIAFAKKFIQDALVKEKVLENDGWAQIESWTDAFTVDAHCALQKTDHRKPQTGYVFHASFF